MSNAVLKRQDELPVTNGDSALLAVIARAAADPNVDLDKMERLLNMQERILAKRAEAEFNAALADMQCEMPTVGERGKASDRYTYALWEDINKAIKPILQKHGFSLSFHIDTANGITVTGILAHKGGHTSKTSMWLPPDASGNKPAVQAVASSVSYGKRYTAGALLNLTSHGEDDDAFLAAGDFITESQAADLTALLQETAANQEKFLSYFKAKSIATLKAKDFAQAVKLLEGKRKNAT